MNFKIQVGKNDDGTGWVMTSDPDTITAIAELPDTIKERDALKAEIEAFNNQRCEDCDHCENQEGDLWQCIEYNFPTFVQHACKSWKARNEPAFLAKVKPNDTDNQSTAQEAAT